MRVTFVTGVSAAGKTTLCRELNENPTALNTLAMDIDHAPKPDTNHLEWLHWRAAQMLYDLTTGADKQPPATHYVICGITWPHSIVDSHAYTAAKRDGWDVRFLLLDLPDKVIRQRLNERLATKTRADRAATIRYNLHLAPMLRTQVAQQRRGKVLPVRHLPLASLVDWAVEDW